MCNWSCYLEPTEIHPLPLTPLPAEMLTHMMCFLPGLVQTTSLDSAAFLASCCCKAAAACQPHTFPCMMLSLALWGRSWIIKGMREDTIYQVSGLESVGCVVLFKSRALKDTYLHYSLLLLYCHFLEI